MKKKNIFLPLLVVGIGAFTGCNSNETNTDVENISVDNGKQLVYQKNVYTSTNIGNGNILFGGEKGMSIINTSTAFQKQSVAFQLPSFESDEEIFRKTEGKEFYKSTDNNSTKIDKSRIYAMLNVEDGVLIGGSFATVNGVEKHNLVKLNYDGSINKDFESNVGGVVYKIVKNNKNLYISGVIGSYNEKEAYSIVRTDLNGKLDEHFMPFKDYLFSKINDIALLDNEHIIVAGTFVKDATEDDANQTEEEMLKLTKTVLVINSNGQIDKKLSDKFANIQNEVFALAVDDEKVYIAGDFKFTVDSINYNNLVAYSLDGELDKDFKIEKLHGMIFDMEVLNDKIVFGGDFLIDNDDKTRSFYVVNKDDGRTIKVDNLSIDADIYSIDIYNGNVILSGDGEFKIDDESFNNSLMIRLD